MRFISVCKHCREHFSEEATVEFNFAEQKIYFLCPKCKKMNEIDLNPKTYLPYPKPRRI